MTSVLPPTRPPRSPLFAPRTRTSIPARFALDPPAAEPPGCRALFLSDCPFRVTAEYATLTDPAGAVVPCFRPKPTDFHPDHHHAPYYVPMDHAAENARRTQLQHDDPSLDAPPLVRAQGFAGSESDSDSASRAALQPQPLPPPQPQPPAAAVPAVAHATTTTTRHEHSPAPLATTPTLQRTPFQHFLLEIDPRFEDYFQYFGEIIPLDTPLVELLSLDSGTFPADVGHGGGHGGGGVEDHTVFNMFRDVKELPLLLVAMAADGVRKAKLRFERAGGGGGGGAPPARLNPKIAEGIEKARAEKWVRERIRQGQLVLAAEGMASSHS